MITIRISLIYSLPCFKMKPPLKSTERLCLYDVFIRIVIFSCMLCICFEALTELLMYEGGGGVDVLNELLI